MNLLMGLRDALESLIREPAHSFKPVFDQKSRIYSDLHLTKLPKNEWKVQKKVIFDLLKNAEPEVHSKPCYPHYFKPAY